MAELCLSCFNKITGEDYLKKDVILSKEYDLCEECGEATRVIIRFKRIYIFKEDWKAVKENWKRRKK